MTPGARNAEGGTVAAEPCWAGRVDSAAVAPGVAGGCDVNARDAQGGTLLHRAAGPDVDLGLVRALLRAGADLDLRDERGNTPLIIAARLQAVVANLLDASELLDRSFRIVRALVRGGADPNGRNLVGRTPLHEALPGMLRS